MPDFDPTLSTNENLAAAGLTKRRVGLHWSLHDADGRMLAERLRTAAHINDWLRAYMGQEEVRRG